jgi:serine/threonine protein kinase/tetratricopeptide (TPR) repeat protein
MPTSVKQIKQYEILEPIGKGGMGEVFLAQDTILDRKVAIKFLPKDLQDDISLRERFFREAKAAAALDHPFICKIYETGETEGKAFIIMEFIEGDSLRDRLDQDGLHLKDTLRITSEIAEALEKAHEKGIVHRDLKPANIMLTPQGHVKIMDFGLAKKIPTTADAAIAEKEKSADSGISAMHIPKDFGDMKTIAEFPADQEVTIAAEDVSDDLSISVSEDEETSKIARETDVSKIALQSTLTQYGAMVGTLAYMSPEQTRGEVVDVRSDIFALGVILYELISKKHPFLHPSSQDTMHAILHDPIPPLKIKPKKLISGLTPILRKALAKETDQRYQNIGDFSSDLQKMQKILHIGSPLFYLSRPAMASLATILILIVAGTFWFARRGRVSASELSREPVSVLVADFENTTGDTMLNGTIEQAVSIGLEGAGFITSYKRPDARQLAGEMFPDSKGKLDGQMALLVSVREGISKFIDGSIEPRGDGYELKVRIRDPVDPDESEEFSRKIKSKDKVLNAAAWIANKVRSSLGDVSADAKKALEGETFTTSSLEAMNAYTNAQELRRQGQKDDAINEYINAIDADPDFGRAYSGLAIIYQNRGQYDEAEKYFQEALTRIDRMSEREKYRTRTIYYLIHRNIQLAIQESTELVSKYPADFNGITNLALAHFFAHNYAEAKEMGRRAVELYPRKVTPRFNLCWYALAAGDFEVAEQEAQEVINLNPDFDEVYVVQALAKLAQGETSQAVDIYTNLETSSQEGQSLAALGLADVAFYEGRLSDAIKIIEDQMISDFEDGKYEHSGNKFSLLAQANLLKGNGEAASRAADEALASSKDIGTMFTAAHVYLQTGQKDHVKPIAEELSQRLGPEPKAYAKIIEGELSRAEGDIQSAIESFSEAQSILDTWLGRLALGKAYLEIEAFMEAHSELDSCHKRKGEATSVFFDDTPTFRFYSSIYYYLGRALEGIGSPGAAEQYQTYLEINRKEDWNDPLVDDARRRLNSLNKS